MLDKMVGMGYNIPSNVAVSGEKQAVGTGRRVPAATAF